MDNRKIVKDFIDYICDWVENEYKVHRNTGFQYKIRDDKLSYLVKDKGIEKRIQKQMFKRLGIKPRIEYKLNASEYRYPNWLLTN